MKTIAELLGCDVFTAYFICLYFVAQLAMFVAYLAKGANKNKKFYNWMMGANSTVTALCLIVPIFREIAFNIGCLVVIVGMSCIIGMFANYMWSEVAFEVALKMQKKRQS